MPDNAGKLSPDEVKFIQGWLNERAATKPHKCPYCDTASWIMGNHILVDQMIEAGDGNQVPVVPYVAFFCQKCAYTIKFNAAMMGLFTAMRPPSRHCQPSTPSIETRSARLCGRW